MLAASCPSCGSPVRFAHAAAPVVVCESCQSTVVRTDLDELVVQGRVSAFGRDLSPVRVGTYGRVGSRRFEVVGVLRKGRDAVRWNEWFIVYDDGGHAWLGEGHGLFQLYEEKPVRVNMQGFHQLSPGRTFQAGDTNWVVLEVAEAKILAAEGSLPFAVDQDQSWPYADLRSADGRKVGTLDGAEGDSLLYAGRVVELPALDPEGLRPITGWSDDVLVNFEGPEVEGVRKLGCPACQAPLELRAPGQATHVSCEYCGSELSLAEVAGEFHPSVLVQSESPAWMPGIKLGSRGTLAGIEYAVIGAMRRGVYWAGQLFDWTEYFLYNPYRGVAWLTRDAGGHWMLVKQLTAFPALGNLSTRSIEWRKEEFRHFQGGDAHVLNVMGEFNWEVRVGDVATTADYVAPPMMLSMERAAGGEEISWSLGQYLDASEIGTAFEVKLGAPAGVAPSQPNPWKTGSAWAKTAVQTAVLSAGVLLFWVFSIIMSPGTVIGEEKISAVGSSSKVELSEVFEVPDELRRNLLVELVSSHSRSDAQVHVALINKDTGKTYLPIATRSSNSGKGWVSRPEPGPYVVRLEVTRSPTSSASGSLLGQTSAKVRYNEMWHTPFLFGLLFSLLGPMIHFALQSAFESRRWAQSDHA